MLVNRTPTAGAQRQSMSDSESDRISSAVRLMGPNKDSDNLIQSPPLRNNVNLEFTRSNPNIFPLGVGLGTCFQARNNPRLLEQQEKAEKMCRKLMKDLDIWIWKRRRMCFIMITPLPPPAPSGDNIRTETDNLSAPPPTCIEPEPEKETPTIPRCSATTQSSFNIRSKII